jgi:hypothetical protein
MTRRASSAARRLAATSGDGARSYREWKEMGSLLALMNENGF